MQQSECILRKKYALARGMQKRAASAAQPGPALDGWASLPELDEVGRVAFYNVGLNASALTGGKKESWLRKLKADVIKAFSELRCDMLRLSEMGEVTVGLESAFAEAESISSGVAQPAPGSLRRWFEGALQEVHLGHWGIYPRGHYVTLVRPDAAIEVESESEVNIYPPQDFRVAQVLRCRTRTVPVVARGAPQPAQPPRFQTNPLMTPPSQPGKPSSTKIQNTKWSNDSDKESIGWD